MPRAKYPLEAGSSKKLEVSWKVGWKDVQIRLDGQLVGQVASKADLKQGKQFALPDGSTVEVRYTRVGLEVLRNGKQLPGSAWDPRRGATIAVFWIAIGGFVIAILNAAGVIQAPGAMAEGLVIGIVFGVLGFFVKRGRKPALAIATVLTVGLLILQVDATIDIISSGGVPLGIGAIAITAGLLIWMIKGLRAMKGVPPATTPIPAEPASELLSCLQCGAKYRTDDYREDVEVWQCSSCKSPMPRKKFGTVSAMN